MTDRITAERRSHNMSRIRAEGNSSTELRLICIMREYDLVGWRRGYVLFGRPDFVFRRQRLAVFVDGDFWHGHPRNFRLPKTNTEFWRKKIEDNRTRDKLVNRELRKRGWRVCRIWESELSNPHAVSRKLKRALSPIQLVPSAF